MQTNVKGMPAGNTPFLCHRFVCLKDGKGPAHVTDAYMDIETFSVLEEIVFEQRVFATRLWMGNLD
jgi:hypothetical protein